MDKERLPSMNKERFKVIPAVYLILIRDNKILMLRRQNTGFEDGNYSLIAGHVDENEGPTRAVSREAGEEAGIHILPENLRLAHVMYRKKPDEERIDFFFITDVWEGEPQNLEPEKCDDLSWFPLDNIPKNTIPHVRDVIENHLVNKSIYSESGLNNRA